MIDIHIQKIPNFNAEIDIPSVKVLTLCCGYVPSNRLTKYLAMENIEHEALLLVKSKMKEKGWDNADLSRQTGMHRSSISKMLKVGRIKLNKLDELSELFNYNFLRALADQSEINNPPKMTADHSACEQRIRELELVNATLMKVLGK